MIAAFPFPQTLGAGHAAIYGEDSVLQRPLLLMLLLLPVTDRTLNLRQEFDHSPRRLYRGKRQNKALAR